MSIQILLVDPYPIEREGLVRWVTTQPDITVVGEAADGPSAIHMARQLTPKVALLVDVPPHVDSPNVIRQLTGQSKDIRVLVLSTRLFPDLIAELFEAGAAGHLRRQCGEKELLAALRAVANGQTPGRPPAECFRFEDSAIGCPAAGKPFGRRLTERECQVLQLLAAGKTTRQAAVQMNLKPKTVEAHRIRLMEKLDLHTTAQLTKFAVANGLTPLD